ncbi:thiolase family protein [Mycobacterium paraintracellulare]|uniref:thiolase family protein n=1 Tax=Mycobacterium paraintracellulare TaxID=1138383 RepID=UPI0019269A01|nr:thiolase family protein [Mycobacterium paraintracellulare]
MTRGIGTTAGMLAVEAARRALDDAGLQRCQVDGLLLAHSPMASCHELGMQFQHVLGLRDLSLLHDLHAEGSSAGQMIQNAALYISAGLVRNVLCVFADAALEPGARAGDTFAVAVPHGHLPGWEAAHGLFGAVAAYGMAARRHMALYGTNEDHFGAVAVAARAWAQGNPLAAAREPMTLAEHHASPVIVDPFRKLDCAHPVNGAIAIVVSCHASAEASRPPIFIAGIGQGHRGNLRHRGEDSDVITGGQQASQQALRMAGKSLEDIDICELYDCFTYATIVTLEDYGFCNKGEAGDFVLDGNIDPGGTLPVNTGGGQLSGYYLQGMTPLSEAMIQLRGDGRERQVPDARVALVGCQGGILDYHACLVLTTEDAHGR